MKKLSVPESMSAGLIDFINDKDLPLEIVAEGGDLQIEETGAERLESDLSILYSGGWVSCPTARAIAGKFGIPIAQMGDMLDHLHVKVRKCGLGCF